MANSKQIVYLSQSQYAELIANGSITVDGVTITYDENDIYVTPQAEPVTDVQVNGVSVLNDGVANVTLATDDVFGVVRTGGNMGLGMYGGRIFVGVAGDNTFKSGNGWYNAVTISKQHVAAFYGLAKAAGDSTQSASSNTVGTYTEYAKSAIKNMFGVGEWVNVADVTLTDATNSVTFTTDRKYYEIYAYVDIKATSESTSLGFDVRNEAGNSVCNRYLGSQVNTTEKITLIRCESMPGMTVVSYNTDNSASQMRSYVNLNDLTDYGIKTITVSAYGGIILFPVGSVIKIYAR